MTTMTYYVALAFMRSEDGLVGQTYPTFREQVLDVAQAERESEVKPNCLPNDLGREPISGKADFRHPPWLPRRHNFNKPAPA
jgi:hypothetical protein